MERLPGYDNWKLQNADDEQKEQAELFYESDDFDPDSYNDMMEDR
jgi:hypothetical protein